MNVEAYIVKGMNTPMLLGNDFADQYSLSIIRREDETHLVLGSSGRRVQVSNSVGPSLVDNSGRVFGIIRSRKYRKRKKHPPCSIATPVHVLRSCVIAPQSILKVPVRATFAGGIEHLYVEKVLTAPNGQDDVYGAPDSIINRDDPYLQIANFSTKPVRLQRGETVGLGHDPRHWLDKWNDAQDKQAKTTYHRGLAVAAVIKELKQSSPRRKRWRRTCGRRT